MNKLEHTKEVFNDCEEKVKDKSCLKCNQYQSCIIREIIEAGLKDEEDKG